MRTWLSIVLAACGSVKSEAPTDAPPEDAMPAVVTVEATRADGAPLAETEIIASAADGSQLASAVTDGMGRGELPMSAGGMVSIIDRSGPSVEVRTVSDVQPGDLLRFRASNGTPGDTGSMTVRFPASTHPDVTSYEVRTGCDSVDTELTQCVVRFSPSCAREAAYLMVTARAADGRVVAAIDHPGLTYRDGETLQITNAWYEPVDAQVIWHGLPADADHASLEMSVSADPPYALFTDWAASSLLDQPAILTLRRPQMRTGGRVNVLKALLSRGDANQWATQVSDLESTHEMDVTHPLPWIESASYDPETRTIRLTRTSGDPAQDAGYASLAYQNDVGVEMMWIGWFDPSRDSFVLPRLDAAIAVEPHTLHRISGFLIDLDTVDGWGSFRTVIDAENIGLGSRRGTTRISGLSRSVNTQVDDGSSGLAPFLDGRGSDPMTATLHVARTLSP
ncbi:MAG: hypothetical protein WKG01_18340 [Kofleriaceae bacterium]